MIRTVRNAIVALAAVGAVSFGAAGTATAVHSSTAGTAVALESLLVEDGVQVTPLASDDNTVTFDIPTGWHVDTDAAAALGAYRVAVPNTASADSSTFALLNVAELHGPVDRDTVVDYAKREVASDPTFRLTAEEIGPGSYTARGVQQDGTDHRSYVDSQVVYASSGGHIYLIRMVTFTPEQHYPAIATDVSVMHKSVRIDA